MTDSCSQQNVLSWPVLGAVLLCAWLSGCGAVAPHSDKVTGEVIAKVTYDGKPVEKGDLNFSNPETGLGGGGPIEAEGMVNIKAIPIGEYKVTVTPPIDMSDPNPKPMKYPDLPEKFRTESKTTLTATIVKGKNELQFELKE